MAQFIRILLVTILFTLFTLVHSQTPLANCSSGSATHYTGTSFMCGFHNIPSSSWRNTIPVIRGFAPDEPW